MICAYCGKEAKGTKEHVISSGILGLFPECFATIDGERSIVHQGDPMVKVFVQTVITIGFRTSILMQKIY